MKEVYKGMLMFVVRPKCVAGVRTTACCLEVVRNEQLSYASWRELS
jgi:hypothetical protein